ncbi:hypothetical protein RV134_340280 [Roseovarius sp. EC-HK134]|nr:hypothetical protein RV134_340280 [Roseovarius sp. EC-HK134]
MNMFIFDHAKRHFVRLSGRRLTYETHYLEV